MATENSVSFKVFLQKEGLPDQPEVRRFGIDRDAVASFGYLNHKLQAVFPTLQGKSFTVHWIDGDGDKVVITSDDELMIALTEMQTDVRKLYVVVKDSAKPQQEPRQDTGNPQPVHAGVTCDGCGKGIQGFRYKCVQCPDFDLCGACESANMHGDHFMIRLPVPITWRPYFGRRLAHHLSKSARKGGLPCGGWGCEAPEGSTCPAGNGPYPCHARGGHGRHHGPHHEPHHGPHHGPHHEPHHGPHHGHHGGLGWLETLSNYLSEFTNFPEASTPPPGEGSEEEQKQRQQQKEYAAEQHMKYLRSVGQTVANLLDPLGIDVDIEVRSKNDSGEKITKNDGNNENVDKTPVNKNVSFADNGSETNVREVASQINHMTISDNATGPEVVASNERTSPETDGWTVLTGMDTQQTDLPGPSATHGGAIPKQPFDAFAPPAAPGFLEAAHQAAHQAALISAQETHAKRHDASHEAARRAAQTWAEQGMEMARKAGEILATRNTQQPMAASGNNNLYPNLGAHVAVSPSPFQVPMQHQQPLHQQPLHQQPLHQQQSIPNQQLPHVSRAVDQMMSMGFTNEGGWLTQLVATHNGNITKVLDILQPVKK